MKFERSIIHINVADFAVAVERRCDSRLRGRPVVVASPGSARAVVYDMSEEAFRAGVRKLMPLGHALRFCREAVLVPLNPGLYERAMGALIEKARPYALAIEAPDANGHMFCDVTGGHRLFGPPQDIAWRIRNEARRDLAMDPIWTVAANKLAAKAASRLVKPVGEYIVEADDEAAFLAPIPLNLLPGITSRELFLLKEFNLTRVGQVAGLSKEHLAVIVGRRAPELYNLARGVDNSPVLDSSEPRSTIVFESAFGDDVNDLAEVEKALWKLVEKAGFSLRRKNFVARRIAVGLRYVDGMDSSGREVVSSTDNDFILFEKAGITLKKTWKRRLSLRSLRFSCELLAPRPAQLDLFEAGGEAQKKRDKIIAATDEIRQRFGFGSVGIARAA